MKKHSIIFVICFLFAWFFDSLMTYAPTANYPFTHFKVIAVLSILLFLPISLWGSSNDHFSIAMINRILRFLFVRRKPSLKSGGEKAPPNYAMINRILRFLFVRRKPSLKSGSEEALLNYALELAQEWGEYYCEPIQGRLGKAYPHFTTEELDRYNAMAQSAKDDGYILVGSMSTLAEKSGKPISEAQWREAYLAKYPWVDKKNLKHLFSTGKYYVWHG